MKVVRGAATVALLILVPTVAAHTGELRFAERVEAQMAIDRIYQAHREGACGVVDEAASRSLAEAKVRTYLRQSAALERYWNRPVEADALERELERISTRTRMPDRLQELFTALEHDPLLVLEALARPSLVGRLARNYYARDASLHVEALEHARKLRDGVARGLIGARQDHPARDVVRLRRAKAEPKLVRALESPRDLDGPQPIVLAAAAFDDWRAAAPRSAGGPGRLLESDEAFEFYVLLAEDELGADLARYAVRKRPWDEWWAQVEGTLGWSAAVASKKPPPAALGAAAVRARGRATRTMPGSGDLGRGIPTGGEWTATLLGAPAPSARSEHTAVWTGSEMIVWGGRGGIATGAIYDPATDTWTPMSSVNAPVGRSGHTALWTGDTGDPSTRFRMIVWGGRGPSLQNTGAVYDLAADSWTPVSVSGAPSNRTDHTAVWTGSRMIVWGGSSGGTLLSSGGIYDPSTDSWTATEPAQNNEVVAVRGHTAVWTGSEMIVWGGTNLVDDVEEQGGRYDPALGTWTALPMDGVPSKRTDHTAVWTGSEMIVWGGVDLGSKLTTGGRYDPATDTWTRLPKPSAPTPRSGHSAVWSGTEMIVWGGEPLTDTGGRYDPSSDTWQPLPSLGAPSSRTEHTAVWADDEMVVWGGYDGVALDSGARFSPATSQWLGVTATPAAPRARANHTSVWTGSEMIVWGGTNTGTLNSGAVYDPITDNWTPTATIGAPSPRFWHTAVWTGEDMVVWGGNPLTDTGGRYDPASDSWTATSAARPPAARYNHTAVWTGTEMIVWGGWAGSFTRSGGRYDPQADRWTPGGVEQTGSPAPRSNHTAVWTGSEMIVWGGVPEMAQGGIYNPATGSWRSMLKEGSPAPRLGHTAVWTGDEMIVWGGRRGGALDDGARFDPAAGTNGAWAAMTTDGAPQRRYSHTAVWSGNEMIVWGGFEESPLSSGGRYDPQTDSWLAGGTPVEGAPSSRAGHTAAWTGAGMIVWGGFGDEYLQTGGIFATAPAAPESKDLRAR